MYTIQIVYENYISIGMRRIYNCKTGSLEVLKCEKNEAQKHSHSALIWELPKVKSILCLINELMVGV